MSDRGGEQVELHRTAAEKSVQRAAASSFTRLVARQRGSDNLRSAQDGSDRVLWQDDLALASLLGKWRGFGAVRRGAGTARMARDSIAAPGADVEGEAAFENS